MSASTAAIPISTPNNHQISLDSNSNFEARKRIIAITTKQETKGTPQTDKARIASGRDPTHTVLGESVLGRQQFVNYPELKKKDALRRRKPSSKKGRPVWLMLSNVFKGYMFVLLIFWVSNAAWKLKEGEPLFGGPATPEERLSEVESVLEKITKLLQVQADLLNKKIEKTQIDLRTLLQETSTALQSEIKKLEGRTDRLDQIVNEFTETAFVKVKDFEEFLEEFRNHKGMSDSTELSLNKVSLDKMRMFAKEIVEREVERHAADGLGIADYALWSGGARVVKHSEPLLKDSGKSSWFGRHSVHSTAQKVLEPSFGEPGQCFALQGSSGYVEIMLRTSIVVQAVTLEHVAKSVAYDCSTAPKDCQVTGWHEGPEDDASTQTERMVHLADFAYDLDKPNAQTFTIETNHMTNQHLVNMVRLSFSSNHGSSMYTCLYRFRVHGFEPGFPSAITLQP